MEVKEVLMISLKVVDVKKFMTNILVDNVFDNFCVSQVNIDTFAKFSIDGRLNLKWFSEEEKENIFEDYSKWSEMKRYAYEIIKGNKVPTSFKIVLLLSRENTKNMLMKYNYQISEKDVEGFFINIMFENNEIHIITGIAYRTVIMDKSLDHEWDNNIKLFMKKNNIEIEEV